EAEKRLDELHAKLHALASEAEEVAFDPEAHRRLQTALSEAEAKLEAVQAEERAASEDLAGSEREAARLEGELKQAREIAARVDDVRSEGRHAERVGRRLDGCGDRLV